MMVKLTKAQEKVLAGIREDVEKAKSMTFYRWVGTVLRLDYWNAREKYADVDDRRRAKIYFAQKEDLDGMLKDARQYRLWSERYDSIRSSQEVCCHAPSGTLRALERRGLVSIVSDSANSRGIGIDRVRLVEEVPVTSDRW